MAVVAHHPVIIHREGVFRGFLPVDDDFAVAFFERVILIRLDDAAEKRKVLRRELHRVSLLRNPDRAVVVLAPAGRAPLREHLVVGGVDVAVDRNDVAQALDLPDEFVREVHVVARAVTAVLSDAEVVDGILREGRRGLHHVVVLQSGYRLLRFAVDPHLSVADFERVARKPHAALDVVLAFVHRTADHRVFLVEALASLLLAERLLETAQRVVIGHVLVFEQHRVARREVEHHHVVAADRLESLETVVGPLDRLGERFLGLREGHRVVYEGERQRRVGHLRSVSHLAHVEVVADEQRPLHRRGGDDVHLEDEDVHQRRHDRREDDGVDPLVNRLVDCAALAHLHVVAPHVAVEELRDVEVEDDRQSQQHPEVARPDHEPERIKQCGQRETDPFVV